MIEEVCLLAGSIHDELYENISECVAAEGKLQLLVLWLKMGDCW